ncbi:MAG: 3-dehydroquinate synthase [Lachnospiraceae bacterium]|nr:3-dehydroquinate synthase [Lachnospiraceae bacterium]
MSERLHINKTESGDAYDIVISGDYNKLPEEISALSTFTRLCIVTDSNVGPLYAGRLQEILRPICGEIYIYTFPAGEKNKTLSEIEGLYCFLMEHRFDRKDILIALGGGVVGDMTGFAAATYLRGIRFVQLPTTLLADTDSSIGGKTGVDLRSYKNMVGAFYMPSLVYISPGVLSTLPDREFSSGMAEVVKHALIKDRLYFDFLSGNRDKITALNQTVLEEMIFKSCRIKARVVEDDPKESGERAVLNFGHTLGHAVENYMNFSLTHGECVSLGMAAALDISRSRNYISEDEVNAAKDLLAAFSLPVKLGRNTDTGKILELSKSDKKMARNKLRFILLKEIGLAVIKTDVTDSEIEDSLKGILE